MEKLKDALPHLPATSVLTCMIMGLANVSSVLANFTSKNDAAPHSSTGLLQVFGMSLAFIAMALALCFAVLITMRFYLINGYKDPNIDRGTAVRLCFSLMATQALLIFSYDEPHIMVLITICVQMIFMIGFFIFSRDQDSSSS